MMKNLMQRASLLGAVVALTACAALQPQTPEDQAMARAQARWDALLKGDFKKGYEYAPPSYRGVTSYDVYRAQFGTGSKWISALVAGATCEPERCQVKIRIELEVPMMGGGMRGRMQQVSTYFDETWVREDGKWWKQEAL